MSAVRDMPRIDALRVPPWSLDSEQAVLGGLMLDANALDRVVERISENDFYRKDHRMIFRAIFDLSARGQPCDAVTMADWFEQNQLAELVGGAHYVIKLANSTPSAANIVAYADIVREKSILRQVIDVSTTLTGDGFAPEGRTAMQVVDGAIAALMAMQKHATQSEFTLRQAMTQAYKAAQAAKDGEGGIPGIHTGLTQLDRVLGGWHRGDLVVIGARPSQGKTALMLNAALACNVPCGIVSAEQPMQQIGARMMSIRAHVPAERMRNGRFEPEDLHKLGVGVEDLISRTCLIYDRSAPTIADVSRIARKWSKQDAIRILFVDYVQRIEAVNADKRTPKHERVGEVVRGLKDLARDLDIPVVALAQVGRHVDTRPDKQPGMGDLSDSSEIEKEADQVLTLYRPHVYDDSEPEALAILSVEKNRHGPTGTVKCAWLAETMRFEDMANGY